jgi:KDO2-lipid IV(A) lauroyltransferase
MLTETAPRPPLTPRYWTAWFAVGAIWLMGKTPQVLGLSLAVPLAMLMRLSMKARRRIAERNIERCFPSLNLAEREVLLRGCFRSLARAVFEMAWSWSASGPRIRRMGHIEGLEHVEAARQAGRGVLLVTAHVSCLEIGARILAMNLPFAAIYRPLRNPVLEWYQNRSRLAYGEAVISKRDMRSAIRLLRQGGTIWYAPDQDFGRDQSLFAPFFGIQTATLQATRRLAQMTGCAVVPMFPVYDEVKRHYIVHIQPALNSFPGPDAGQDLARINAVMEAYIRSAPQQYWWIHRRFKTRPAGEAPFYD